MSVNRSAEMLAWRFATIEARAEWARRNILNYMAQHRSRMRELTGADCYDEMPDYITSSVDAFIDLAIMQECDDENADKAAMRLVFAMDGFARGAVPDLFLYRGALGPRVRARLLTEGWTDGKSGSVLGLWRPGRDVLCEYFWETDERFLMDDEEHAELARLRSVGTPITIYRGARMKPTGARATGYAMSWTRDLATARRFAAGSAHGTGASVVLSAQYDPAHILALWETSGREPEVVVNPRRLRSIAILEQPSMRLAA